MSSQAAEQWLPWLPHQPPWSSGSVPTPIPSQRPQVQRAEPGLGEASVDLPEPSCLAAPGLEHATSLLLSFHLHLKSLCLSICLPVVQLPLRLLAPERKDFVSLAGRVDSQCLLNKQMDHLNTVLPKGPIPSLRVFSDTGLSATSCVSLSILWVSPWLFEIRHISFLEGTDVHVTGHM